MRTGHVLRKTVLRRELLLPLVILCAGCGKEPGQSGPERFQREEDMEHAKSDCENILNVLMPFAEDMLVKHGEFFPFGGTMAPDGVISQVAASQEEGNPSSADVVERLRDRFRDGAAKGEIKATGIAYDMLITPPGAQNKQDAVALALDHRDGYSVVVVFPYRLSPVDGLVVDDPFAVAGDGAIFPP